MCFKKKEVVLRLTSHQVYRLERLDERLWKEGELSLEEIGRRLLLEYLLWVESEQGLVERIKTG
jgi:hypothetical protein